MPVSDYLINNRWTAETPDVLQLYSFPTPNGQKVSIMLEEVGIPYEAHLVTLADADVRSPEFLSVSPNNKIPAIVDPDGPDGETVALFESGAILIYLGDKTGFGLPKSGAKRAEVIQWLMWQMAGLGPMFGQLGFFVKFAGAEIEDPRPRERYINEAKRLLTVLDTALEGKDWIAGDYSIADIAICPWLNTLEFYGAKEMLGFDGFKNVAAYSERFNARPAFQTGRNIPARPE